MIKQKHKLFSNNTARNTFFTLVCGIALIFTAAIFTITEIQQLSQNLTHTKKEIAQVRHLIELASAMPKNKTLPLMFLANNHLPNVQINDQPIKGAKLIPYNNLQTTEQLLTSSNLHNKFSLQLTPYHWLNVNEQPQINHILWTMAGFYLIAFILLFALITLCFWAIKRLNLPLTELLQDTQIRIRKSLHDRTQMLAAISHDLRTPITRLKLRTEYFADSPQYKEMLADFAEMENMISSVLLFAREDAYKEPIERFDLDALLDSLCEDMINAGLKVKYHSYGERLPFSGRINNLKRAFSNLITNAVKYGKQADVKLYCKHDQVQIEINDKGPGIPEAALEKVFEPFYRVEQSRSPQTGGTGLGLAIARDAILAHDGDIVLRNFAKGGLQAMITLLLNPPA